jgi:aminoglycoside phosphotransferase (APT) family kinase protein
MMTTEPEAFTQDEDEVREMARVIVQHHFGRRPRRLIRQESGLSNFVFLVKHAREQFVVRLSLTPTRLNAYIKEQWATAKAREAGVPTPDILEVGNQIVPYPYMIARMVRGQEATWHPARLSILREMGHYAALIHTVPTTGFGHSFDWSKNQLSRNETWRDFLQRELGIEARITILEKHRMLTPSQLKTLCATLKKMADQKLKPALNHGDLRLKNIIVEESGAIAAIIDWEKCMSNLAPHWDLSLALHDLSIDEKQEFLAGYGLSEREVVAIAPMLKALNLINYAPEIERLAEAKDTARLEQYRTRLHGVLDLYSL